MVKKAASTQTKKKPAKAKTVTQAEAGIHLGITDRAVRDLLTEFQMPRKGFDLDELRLNYLSKLRESAAGRERSEESIDAEREMARLTKERADKLAMENEQTRGDLIPAEVATMLFAALATDMAAVLDNLPAKIKRQIPGIASSDMEMVKREIVRAQNEASEIDQKLTKILDDLDLA